MKVAAIVGARPQFIKAAPVSEALREVGHREFLIHTGQHYDYGMSRVFFEELGIAEPDVNLGVGGAIASGYKWRRDCGIIDVACEQRGRERNLVCRR